MIIQFQVRLNLHYTKILFLPHSMNASIPTLLKGQGQIHDLHNGLFERTNSFVKKTSVVNIGEELIV